MGYRACGTARKLETRLRAVQLGLLRMKAHALVAWNLRRIRVRRGVSQERLAYDAEIDRSYVGGLERQTENPTIDLLDRLVVRI
jgi:DNA-binding XRE family transcriptional regulator